MKRSIKGRGAEHICFKHGMSESPELTAYYNARHRCCASPERNPKDYKNYVAKGVKFLFKNFEQFYAVLGPKPTPRHSLGRYGDEGNYEPGNCKWMTPKEQYANRRNP